MEGREVYEQTKKTIKNSIHWHFALLEKGPQNSAWVDPPLIRAMPERKRFLDALASLESIIWHD